MNASRRSLLIWTPIAIVLLLVIAIAAYAFSQKPKLELGVGYGVNWIPFVELPIDSYTVVPQGDFFFRF